MEIISTNPATLCNYEVMSILQNVKGIQKKQKGQLATITYETLRYLESTPCKLQNPESIKNCLQALEPFQLNKSEKLMLINNPPTSALEIQLMIDEGEERLTQQQVDDLVQLMDNHFPQAEQSKE